MAKDNKIGSYSLALLRVVLGLIFIYHGFLKLFVTGGFTGTVNFFASIGIPLAVYSALLVSLIEFFGGLFLLLGVITKWSATLLILQMLVAFLKVHVKNGFLVSKGGYEFVLLILAGLIVVLASGAGKFSVGSYFKNRHLK